MLVLLCVFYKASGIKKAVGFLRGWYIFIKIWWFFSFILTILSHSSTIESIDWLRDSYNSNLLATCGKIVCCTQAIIRYHEFHETLSVTFIVLVNSHQGWKQTRNRWVTVFSWITCLPVPSVCGRNMFLLSAHFMHPCMHRNV